MILCKIKKCLPFNAYLLEVKKEIDCKLTERSIELQIEFYGMDKPKENSYLFFSERLLDKNSSQFTQPYSFELFKGSITKTQLNSDQFAVLKTDEINYILKRIYG